MTLKCNNILNLFKDLVSSKKEPHTLFARLYGLTRAGVGRLLKSKELKRYDARFLAGLSCSFSDQEIMNQVREDALSLRDKGK